MPDDYGVSTYDQALPTLGRSEPGGPIEVPESRITSAVECRALTTMWINNDNNGRSQKRAKVDGLIQGNVPYSRADLIAAGRKDATNVNWRTAEAFEESAIGAIYDIFSESPTYCNVELYDDPKDPLSDGDPNTIVNWSLIVTEEFDNLLKSDRSWDSVMQNSIRDTVRFGAGPLIFENEVDWRNRNVPFAYLQVPDSASSDINRWEVAAVRVDYLPHELYEFIRDPAVAAEVGWDVETTKVAIMSAATDIQSAGITLTWEWAQQQLKQNSFAFSARSKIIQAVHFFAKEFPRKGQDVEGKISHVIFVLNPQQGDTGEKFLCKQLHKYTTWQECIHPMYYSQGQGGRHYGVTGMGVKMYGAMEVQNRMVCNMVDKAFAPKIMFKPTSASGKQKMLPTRHGDYMVLPDGYDAQQVSLGSMIEEGLALNREIGGIVSANLSTYRQNLEQPKQGNPITRGEAEIRAADQARLGKTQHNRYYEQLDWLYEEKYRRAAAPGLTKSDPGGAMALEFQTCCIQRGVPKAMLSRFRTVKAARVVGQGSQYLRTQTLDFFLGLAGALPEEGRANVIKDAIAARAGQYMVSRYYPEQALAKMASDQQAEAVQMVAVMKVGIPPVVTSTQNAMIFAQTYLQAGAQALASLQQAGPNAVVEQGTQVLAFLQLVGPAAAAQLQRMAQDPTRKQAMPALTQQFKQLATATDQLKAKVAQVMQARQEAAQRQQMEQMQAGQKALAAAAGQDPATVVGLAGVASKSRIDAAKAQAQLQLKARKQQADIALKAGKERQSLVINDAKAAQDILVKQAEHRQAMAHAEDDHDMAMNGEGGD